MIVFASERRSLTDVWSLVVVEAQADAVQWHRAADLKRWRAHPQWLPASWGNGPNSLQDTRSVSVVYLDSTSTHHLCGGLESWEVAYP